MTEINWREITAEDQLDEMDQLSKEHFILIYKHSTRCSVSAATLSRLERKWNGTEASQVIPYFLDLIACRSVSGMIAERYGVRHESPQVLVIRNGTCVYHNSHFGIAFDEILENISRVPI